tara:strand:- start:2754 stop:3500 length:747 start_codon:yes stop_codon:yes gene_type:complete
LKFGRFEINGKIFHGIVENDHVHELDNSFLHDNKKTGVKLNLEQVKILPPVIPNKMLALAKNYGSHLQGESPPRQPEPFFKTTSSIIGHKDIIILPDDSERIDAESELVLVIGKKAKNVQSKDAFKYIFGYTCGNDVSARDWQKGDKSWWRAKSSDTFSPLGPFIVNEINPENLEITGIINGEVVQKCNTSEMIWTIPKTIEFISKYVTLEIGDCIFTGTSGTAGQIKSGDEIIVEIENVGKLINNCS